MLGDMNSASIRFRRSNLGKYATLPFFQSAVNPVGTEEGW
jgi:hypothetical protein